MGININGEHFHCRSVQSLVDSSTQGLPADVTLLFDHWSLGCCSHSCTHVTTPGARCVHCEVLLFWGLHLWWRKMLCLWICLWDITSFKCSGMSFCDTRQSIQNFKEKWASLCQGTWPGLWKHTISYLFMFYFRSLSIFEIFLFVSLYLESTFETGHTFKYGRNTKSIISVEWMSSRNDILF